VLYRRVAKALPFLQEIRDLLNRAAGNDALPDYRVRYEQESDRALFYTKDGQALARHLAAVGTSGTDVNQFVNRPIRQQTRHLLATPHPPDTRAILKDL
jgi:hypothetical protein